MVSLEQVKLLESKVSRVIDYLAKVTEEKAQLKEKLSSYQKRIHELEVLVKRFKDDQSRIEDGILSALDRLNQFEDALENKISPEAKVSGETNINTAAEKKERPAGEVKQPRKPAEVSSTQPSVKEEAARVPDPLEPEEKSYDSGELDIF